MAKVNLNGASKAKAPAKADSNTKTDSKPDPKDPKSSGKSRSPFIVRPSSSPGIGINKTLLKSLGLAGGDFVAVSKHSHPCVTLQVVPRDDSDEDIVEISAPFRRAARLLLGDRVEIKKVSRPEVAHTVVLYSEMRSTDSIRAHLLELRSLVVGLSGPDCEVVFINKQAGEQVDSQDEQDELSSKINKLTLKPESHSYVFAEGTEIIWTAVKPTSSVPSYSSLAGLDRQIKLLKTRLQLPLQHQSLFSRFSMSPERGFLLYGPPGTGKSMLLRAIAHEADAQDMHVINIDGPSIVSKYLGESEATLRQLFVEAQRFQPTVVLMDELDAIVPRRGGDSDGDSSDDSGSSQRLVATLLSVLDGVGSSANSRFAVIGATNRISNVDPALRRPGRFGIEVDINIPDAAARASILELHLARMHHHTVDRQFIVQLSSRAHGYVGADIVALCREAVMNTVDKAVNEGLAPHQILVGPDDLQTALKIVRPSAMREIALETPQTRWSDIGGQDDVKHKLREAIEWPLQHPKAFKRLGVRPPRGVLLYGPPGCSKTLMARALATEAGLNFLAVKGPELFNKYVGESERAVRTIFRRARAAAPSVIFFDEIDALSVSRGEDNSGDRVLTSLLTEMDGIEALNGVVVLAATNRPDAIDSALMRPGRLDRLVYVGPPDLASRKKILQIELARMRVVGDVDVDVLAKQTEGCSGAEVVHLCQEAGLEAMNRDIEAEGVAMVDFERAVAGLKRQITEDMLRYFVDFAGGL